MNEQPDTEKSPIPSKYIKGQFTLTPEEIEKVKQKGDLAAQQEKIDEATEKIQEAGVIEISEDEEENAEEKLDEGLREAREAIKKAQEKK